MSAKLNNSNNYPKNKFNESQLQELENQAKKEGIEKIVVAGIITNKDGKFLLMRRKSDDFMGGINELPSGKMEDGEDIKSALIREIKEETNLDVDNIIRYAGHFDYLSGSGKKVRQFNFIVSVKKGEIKLTEHDAFFWSSKDEEPFTRITESVRKILTDLEF